MRTEIAASLVARIDPPGLVGAAIVGSVGRGLADAWSDLELLLVWDAPPETQVRDEIQRAWGATAIRRFTRPERWFGVDNLDVRGFPVDLIHQTEASLDETASAVEASAELPGQEVLANLVSARWLRGARPPPVYSDGLAALTLERHVHPLPLGSALVPALRDDRVRYADRAVRWAKDLALALYAANRRFWPGDRALIEGVAALPDTPPGVESRLRTAFSAHPSEGVLLLSTLLDESLALAAHRVPGWSSAERVRSRAREARRCAWTEEELQGWLAAPW
ncbi:MAG: hypothetical protein ABMA64_13475 [Myxococcota bacterium]